MNKKITLSNSTAKALRESINNNDYGAILNSLQKAYNEIYIRTEDYRSKRNKTVISGIVRENRGISVEKINKKLDEFWNYCDFNNIWIPVTKESMVRNKSLTEADEKENNDDDYINSFGYDDRNEEKLSGNVEKDFDKLIQTLRSIEFPQLGKALDKICDDPKLYNLLKLGFGEGELAEVTMGVNDKDFGVAKLIPTQNEIGLDASLKFALSGKCPVDAYFSSPALSNLPPIVTYNGTFIIDGHHRWSQVYIMNPDATIACVNFTYKKKSPMVLLRNMQGAIAVANKGIESHTVNAVSNIYNMNESQIKDYIEENIVDSCVEGLVSKKVCKDKNSAIEYLTKNAIDLKVNNEPYGQAPNREAMPQTDDNSLAVASSGQTEI